MKARKEKFDDFRDVLKDIIATENGLPTSDVIEGDLFIPNVKEL